MSWQTAPLVPYKRDCCTVGGTGCQYKDGSPECQAAMRQICGSATQGGTQKCKDWAIKYPAVAEPAVKEYCLQNGGRYNDPWCACILSKASNISGALNPWCYDEKCAANTAFHPTYMTQAKCPDVVDCTQIVTMQNMGISIAPSVNVESNCGTTKPPSKPISWTMIITVIMVLFAVITSIIVIILRRGTRA